MASDGTSYEPPAVIDLGSLADMTGGSGMGVQDVTGNDGMGKT